MPAGDADEGRGGALVVAPAALGDSAAVVPLFSWYKTSLFGAAEGAPLSQMERYFDGACQWPASVGDPADERNSLHPGIADFMLGLNAAAEKEARRLGGAGGRTLLSFSHFIPWPELYNGYMQLEKVMGCNELGEQVARIGSAAHVFGHSHLPCDRTLRGTRFVQRALGYPRERWGGAAGPPRRLWP